MKNQRLKQFIISLGVVLSLFTSSLSICACSHHSENNSTEPSCHEHSSEMMTMDMSGEAVNSKAVQNSFSKNEHCNCVQPAPKVFSKSELVKIEKYPAEIFPPIEVKTELISQSAKSIQTNFPKPFYLSDSFYNIKSPRAPPRS